MKQSTDPTPGKTEIDRLLAEQGHGFLGITTPEGWPSVVPVNFVHLDGRIYFHGAAEGEKMTSLEAEPRVSFTVVRDLALVPSHYRHPQSACPATQYFQSVMIRGRVRFVEPAEEKAQALQALMEKLQPEGGYEPLTETTPRYRESLRTTAVTAIEIERVTGKFKLGQNLPPRLRASVADKLEQRGRPIDRATAALMRRTLT